MRAFTYLIVNKLTGRWYYGVRYAKGCSPSDMLRTYFTSSKEVNDDIAKLGVHNFSVSIRRTFDDVDAAKLWESTFLKRIKLPRTDSYNKHHSLGLPILSGELNPSKRPELRANMRRIALNRTSEQKAATGAASLYTKNVKALVKLFKRKDYVIARSSIKKYTKLMEFLLKYKSRNVRMIKTLDNVIQLCKIKPRYHVGPRGKNENISKSKIGKKWYTSPDGIHTRTFAPGETVPNGWVHGIKTDRTEKIRLTSTGRLHSIDSKLKMSARASKRIYYTSPDLTELRYVYDENDAPLGWIKGNKLKTRNEKITKYLKEVRYGNDKE